ncbi:MAG: prepilin-type N-terminal cleavage/methylation domain-containing protein [Gemmatimonadales bacterium]|nr:prepilin-type N-terminal cleavage/methylation domain-containing protein [Gemmatimonadales bacterium]
MRTRRPLKTGLMVRWGGGCSGFSLIEVLIAISVLAVTMTAAFSLFSSGIKLRSATRERMADDQDMRLLMAALADDFTHLIPTGPRPFVSPDTIVLLRSPQEVSGRLDTAWVPQLVTYQWAGSVFQDSSLIRVVTPLVADIADSSLVAQEFDKWTGVSSKPGFAGNEDSMLRTDSGIRFGNKASLNGLNGAWVGYPEIKEFGFAVVNEMDFEGQEQIYCRLRVRMGIGPGSASGSAIAPDSRFHPIFPGSWGPDCGSDIEVGLWVPLVRWQPASLTANLDDWGRS